MIYIPKSIKEPSQIGGLSGERRYLDIREKYLRDISDGVPHYSVMFEKDTEYAYMYEVLYGGRANLFTDDAGNTIYFGFYECKNQDNYAGYDCKNPQPFKVLYDTEAISKGFSKDMVRANTISKDREVGHDFLIRTVIKNYHDLESKMRDREAKGFNPVPYYYLINDVTPTTGSSVLKSILPMLLSATVGLALSMTGVGVALGAVAIAAIQAGVDNISKKLAAGEPILFRDIQDTLISLAPMIMNDAEVISKLSSISSGENDYIEKAIKVGTNIYAAVENDDYAEIANALSISTNYIDVGKMQGIYEDIEDGNVLNLSRRLNVYPEEIETAVQTYENNKMIKSLAYDYDRLQQQSYYDNNALDKPAVQQFLVNVAGETKADELRGMVLGLPNAVGAMKLINDNHKLSLEETQALTNVLQDLPVNNSNLTGVLTKSLIEKAKASKTGEFVIPSNVPLHLHKHLSYEIEKSVPGVKTMSLQDGHNIDWSWEWR